MKLSSFLSVLLALSSQNSNGFKSSNSILKNMKNHLISTDSNSYNFKSKINKNLLKLNDFNDSWNDFKIIRDKDKLKLKLEIKLL